MAPHNYAAARKCSFQILAEKSKTPIDLRRHDMAMPDPLEKDIAKFNELLPTLTANEGKFALIFQGELKGVFDTYADALAAGYKEAGLEPFLVKRIATVDFVSYFTRDIDGACRI